MKKQKTQFLRLEIAHRSNRVSASKNVGKYNLEVFVLGLGNWMTISAQPVPTARLMVAGWKTLKL